MNLSLHGQLGPLPQTPKTGVRRTITYVYVIHIIHLGELLKGTKRSICITKTKPFSRAMKQNLCNKMCKIEVPLKTMFLYYMYRYLLHNVSSV